MHPAFRTRRLLVAITIALLISGPAIVLATDESESSPVVHVGEMLPGDEARFVRGDGTMVYDFHVASPEWFPTADGELTLASRVGYNVTQVGANGASNAVDQYEIWIDARTRSVLAKAVNEQVSYDVEDGGYLGVAGRVLQLPIDHGVTEEHRVIEFGAHAAPPCFLLHPLQGVLLAPGDELHFDERGFCGQHGSHPASFAVSATVEQADGGLASVLQSAGTRWGRTFLMQDGVPYPLEVRQADTRELLWTMTHFERGSKEVLPAAFTMPRVVQSHGEWNIDVADTGHEFDAGQAIDAVRADPMADELRAFLGREPDAYIAIAENTARITDGGRQHDWTIVLAGHDDDIQITVAWRVDEFSVGGSQFESVPRIAWEMNDVEQRFPPPDQVLPLPTWQALLQREAIMNGPAPSQGVPFLSLRHVCMTPECHVPQVEIQAGWLQSQLDSTVSEALDFVARQAIGSQYGQMDAQRWVLFDGDARFYSAASTSWVRQSEPSRPAALSMPAAVEPEGRVVSWPSGAKVAGLAGLGVVGAVAYLIWPVIKNGAVTALFSRVTRETALQHHGRRRVYEAISADPGIHVAELARRLGRSAGGVRHHLRKLIEVGLVRRGLSAGYACYYPGGRSFSPGASASKSAVARAIIDAVNANPGVTPSELARTVGVALPTVSYHVHRLVGSGIIKRSSVGRRVHLQP